MKSHSERLELQCRMCNEGLEAEKYRSSDVGRGV